jgi:hypothetical protein
MATLLELDTGLETVSTPVQFTVDNGTTPVAQVREMGAGPDSRTGKYEEHEIQVRDARPIADQLVLDRDGFTFQNYATAVKDFYDEDEVRAVYYPEMERLVKDATGCSRVVVFDHTIRIDDDSTQAERKVRSPVRNMHNDFTIKSAAQRVRDLLPAEAEALLKKRFGSINIWRPIIGPVETAPLAICSWGSIEDRNLIAAERRYQDRIGGVYHLSYNPAQRWYYFPRMECEEVVILKCFDSLDDGTARWTAHGAFRDPKTPAGATPRESIEIRTLYFFD